MKVISLWI